MRLLLSLLLFMFIGCSDSSDSQVTGGEFTVHFEDTEDHELAKGIVKFWKEDSLLTGKAQDVRLKRTNKGYDLLLISSKMKVKKDLTFDDIKSLTTLENRLQKKVFGGEDVSIVIADENFKPLFRPTM